MLKKLTPFQGSVRYVVRSSLVCLGVNILVFVSVSDVVWSQSKGVRRKASVVQQRAARESPQSTFQPCILGLAELPVLRGFSVGMSSKAVRETLGFPVELKEDRTVGGFWYLDEQQKSRYKAGFSEVGVKKISGSPLMDEIALKGEPEGRADFDGVTFYSLDFYKDRLFEIYFAYEDKKQFRTIQSFTSSLSATLKLPNPSWRYSQLDATLSWMNCSNVTVFAQTKPLSIRIVDHYVNEHVKSLAAEKLKAKFDEERKTEELKRFKP